MTSSRAEVFVVDDDEGVRGGLERLISAAGYDVRTFAAGADLLETPSIADAGCLVLDVRMPGQSGIELQTELERRGVAVPIVFLTGHATVRVGIGAMKNGAVDFLEKPASPNDLIDAIEKALARGARQSEDRAEVAEFTRRLEKLTPREREVFEHVVAGRLNRETGELLGVTEKTVKVHRARVMAKMEAASLAELVGIADRLGLGPRLD